MNPPPPRFPAGGCTTASANPVATAASTALPPACMISTPARDANSCTLTTTACGTRTGSVEAERKGAPTVTDTIQSKINDLCGNRMLTSFYRLMQTIEASRGRRKESNQVRNQNHGSYFSLTHLAISSIPWFN